MLRIAALLTATYLAAFLTTSAMTAPDGLSVALVRITGALDRIQPAALLSAQDAQDAQADETPAGTRGAAPARPKQAALPRLRGAIAPAREASELTALPGGRLALRDAEGRLLFLHDPADRTTVVARGARLPRLLVEPAGDAPRLDVTPAADAPPAETEVPTEADEPLASGCESAVSSLARPRAGLGGVLCLAAL